MLPAPLALRLPALRQKPPCAGLLLSASLLRLSRLSFRHNIPILQAVYIYLLYWLNLLILGSAGSYRPCAGCFLPCAVFPLFQSFFPHWLLFLPLTVLSLLALLLTAFFLRSLLLSASFLLTALLVLSALFFLPLAVLSALLVPAYAVFPAAGILPTAAPRRRVALPAGGQAFAASSLCCSCSFIVSMYSFLSAFLCLCFHQRIRAEAEPSTTIKKMIKK